MKRRGWWAAFMRTRRIIPARVATATRIRFFRRRSEVGGVSAECSAHLRAMPRHGGMAKKHGLASVYPSYIDSIHGFALSKEGLLVAANCQSCHGSHHILSHTDPQSPTYKAKSGNLRKMPCGHHATTTGACTARPCGRATWMRRCARTATRRTRSAADGSGVPHAVDADLRIVPQGKILDLPRYVPLATWARWAAMWRRRAAGTATERTRCCRRPIRAAPVNKANLVKTCGGAMRAPTSFVQYQPHANAHNRKLNPALYFMGCS
jgi:hypothetical protein